MLCFCLLYASFLSAFELDLPKFVDATKWDKVAAYLKHINRKPEDVSQLFLQGHDLKEIPSWVFEKVKNVQMILLNKNAIVSIPAAIGELKKLKHFEARYNKIISVHADIQKATALEWVNFGNNKLPKIPEGVYHLPNLKTLFMNGNNIRNISSKIGFLQKLTSLDMWGNPLKHMPKEICQLKQLRSLNLGKTNIVGLPKEIKALKPSIQFISVKSTPHLAEHSAREFIGKSRIRKIFGDKAKF